MNPEQVVQAFKNRIPWEEALQNRGAVHDGPAVYAFVTLAPFQRLNSQSRILYIGKAACLGGSADTCRLYSYRYAPGGQHGARIRNSLTQIKAIGHTIFLAYQILESETEAKNLETELLDQCLNKHLELPPLNRRK